MKRIYFLLLSMLFVLLAPAEAQVSGIADFYGKCKFTADIEFTAAGGSCYLLSQSGYYIVCRPWNVDACNDGQKSALTFNYIDDTRFRITNANGYFKVENVGGVVYPFCDAPASAAAPKDCPKDCPKDKAPEAK